MDRHARGVRERAWRGLPLLVFGLACLASAATWIPAHDEGVSFRQAFGPVPLKRMEPASAASVFARVDGQETEGAASVLEAVMQPGGMHPPGYPLFLHAWASLFGTRRLSLIAPALLAGWLALLAFRRLLEAVLEVEDQIEPARRQEAAFFATSWLAASAWWIAITSYARPYAFVVALALVTTAWVPGLLAREQTTRRVGFALLSSLGLYTLYHYAFVLVFQAVWLGLECWRARDLRAFSRALAIAGGVVVLYAPWLPRLAQHLQVTGEASAYFRGAVPFAQWPAAALDSWWRFALGEVWGQPTLVAFVLAALALALGLGGALLALRALSLRTPSLWTPLLEARAASPARSFWWATAALPVALGLADWLHGSHTLFVTKTAFLLWPLSLCWIARGWMRAAPWVARGVGVAMSATLLAASVVAVAGRDPGADGAAALAPRLVDPERAASHWVAVPSRMPGYAYPFLMSLRDAGFDGSLIHASVLDLDPLLAQATREGVTRLSLVDLDVPYGPAQRWGARGLQAFAQRARRQGWQVSATRPADEASPWLEIHAPVTVRYLGF